MALFRRTFFHEIFIAEPAARVWEVLSEVETWSEWTPSISTIQRLEAGPIGVGSRVGIKQPKLRACVMTITTWNPGKGFVWETGSPGLRATASHEIIPADGGVRVALEVIFEGMLAPLVGALAGKLTRKYIAWEAAGLKERSESRRH